LYLLTWRDRRPPPPTALAQAYFLDAVQDLGRRSPLDLIKIASPLTTHTPLTTTTSTTHLRSSATSATLDTTITIHNRSSRASMDRTETFGAGGTARERALLSWTHAYEDVEFDVRLDDERAGLGADERRGLLHGE
jgi:hypothetical protein